MKFVITEELANKILNYLAGKPFVEVNALIQELARIEALKETEEEEEIKDK
ncbi:MAG: hypothetical protein DDT19_02749 [Syntrophomonadaceae bacterium]|nr:hypothetical protein [Bacillota bacterium]